ncbi:dTDP-glucose 4,6-dehydratase [Amycolatopsis lurida]|uniref:dTDP-glucose 4,6-dehydratase n=1 Tax=Amycolatopsis lurida NRRL 2430 TaxID=1460371 RepID=A0A2P2FW52_AMYLU|nr:dTDP-glucose 4,6-dehydratase [Amycolatopsis lurida]KFU80944.1 spore coat protein [Amycolatopsis lurida NRRL 2430]SED90676.1 dTDP-glucose 4,6-dehydratase [Amycolatopsis lurida]
MRLLVTGAAGFIGSHFVRHWVREHPDDNVVALDALTYAGTETNLADVSERITFVHADIADAGQVLREHDIEVIVNFAAESHNSLAILDPGRFFRTNVLGTQALLEAARQSGVGRFHHISTCEVYGDLALDAEQAFTEESPYRPRTPYNASKAGADHAVRAYHETFGLPVTITNCANNYGSHQFPEKVLPLFTTHALDRRPLPVYASKDNRREWIHALDHVRAIEAVLDRGRIGETYHVGTGDEASVGQIANLVLEELGLPASLQREVPDRPGHDRRYLLDSTKIRRELGWKPLVGFETGMRETVRWYADNRDWWEPLRDRSPVTEGVWTG